MVDNTPTDLQVVKRFEFQYSIFKYVQSLGWLQNRCTCINKHLFVLKFSILRFKKIIFTSRGFENNVKNSLAFCRALQSNL